MFCRHPEVWSQSRDKSTSNRLLIFFIGSLPGEVDTHAQSRPVGDYIAAGNAEANGPGAGASGGHTDITNWVAANFTPTKVASNTIYHLTSASGSPSVGTAGPL